jgi:hypothetical protein
LVQRNISASGARDAEHVGQHVQRERRGEIGDEVARALAAIAGHLGEEIARDPLDLVLAARARARREPVARRLAIARVLGRIHVEQVAGQRALAFDRRAPLEDGQPGRIQEALGLFGDPDDVVALHDRPEADAAGEIEPVDGGLFAQPLPGGVGIAVTHEGIGADDVEGAGECALVHRRRA